MRANAAVRDRLIRAVICLGLILAVGASRAAEDEYAVKAAFLIHFINYISWPDDALGPPGEPIRLCMVGGNPFGKSIEPITRKKAHGRSIELVQDPPADTGKPCRVVFFGTREASVLEQQLETWKSAGVLTVGDTARILDLGGVIGYVTVNNRVRFALNDQAAREAGLKVSVKLRKVAVRR